MKRKALTLFFFLIAGITMSAQQAQTEEKVWKFTGNMGLNASATGLWNWTAGGNSSMSGLVFSDLRLIYMKDKIAWESKLNMKFGLSWNDTAFDKLRKANDKLNFSTKFGWEFHKSLYLSFLGSMDTQFAFGRNYNGKLIPDPIISKFMAPGYFDLSLGIDFRPDNIFSLYVAPAACRLTTALCSNDTNERYFNQLIDFTVNNITQLAKDMGYDGDIHDKEEIIEFAKWYWDEEKDLAQKLNKTYGLRKFRLIDPETGQVEPYYSNHRADLGFLVKGAVDFKRDKFTLNTSLLLFTPYAWDKRELYFFECGTDGSYFVDPDEDFKEMAELEFEGYMDNNRRFGNFDIDWTTALSYQILKCLQVTIMTDFRYYNGVKIPKKCTDESCPIASFNPNHEHSTERVQFKGTIGFGLGYSF